LTKEIKVFLHYNFKEHEIKEDTCVSF